MKYAFAAAALLIGAVMGASAGPADPRLVPIAFIDTIEGTVALKPSGEVLNQDRDRGRILYAGESLSCGPGAKVKAAYLDGEKTVGVPDFCKPPSHTVTDKMAAQDTGLRDGLLRLGRIGGRDKGSESPIFDPAPDAAIRPEAMVVHWRTRPPLDTFTAVLQDASGNSLAQVPAVNGSAGVLDSSALRDALLKLRGTTDAPVAAKLVFEISSGPAYKVNFTVLSEREERELKAKLEKASAPGGLLAHVQSAGVLASYKLHGEVAAEYRLALDEAPHSLTLLRATMDAYARIGDLGHAREIRDRLDKEEDGSSQ